MLRSTSLRITSIGSVSFFVLLLAIKTSNAQAKLIINGGTIILNNGVSLVIDNAESTGITRLGSGFIRSEQQDNKIVWTVGSASGSNYLIPFGNGTDYFPMKFDAASGIGKLGQLVMSTYRTPTWKNSDALPTGVTNLNAGSGDSSEKIVDRFWQISPRGYSSNPSLANIIFTYNDYEIAPPNKISEQRLLARRWNPNLQVWDDYLVSSIVNSGNNTLAISSIPGNQLYDWWSLADLRYTFVEITHLNFKAIISGTNVITLWTTDFEHGLDHFEVWRSQDGLQFETIGAVPSKDNGALRNNYSLNDNMPYSGISYYKLKIFAKDGSYKWSDVVVINFGTTGTVFVFPNPASDFIVININNDLLSQNPIARLYDAKGSLLQSVPLTAISQQLNLARLAKGAYVIRINYSYKIETLRFIKK